MNRDCHQTGCPSGAHRRPDQLVEDIEQPHQTRFSSGAHRRPDQLVENLEQHLHLKQQLASAEQVGVAPQWSQVEEAAMKTNP